MPVADDPNDPDAINAYFDQAPSWDEGNVVVPFRRSDAKPVSKSDMPVIRLQAGELHNIATEAEAALIAADTPFYVRGEQLVRPVTDDLPASHGRRTKVARLSDVGEPVMIDRLSRSALWIKWDARAKKYVPADPTPKVAATVLARDGEWTFRKLTGVITTPTLRPDGTILSEPGYDPATQLLLLDPPVMPALPPRPTKKHAERAPVLTAGRNEEETEKRLVAALLSGQTIISIDNVNGQLGGDALCQIIERPVVAVRPLGQSTFTKVESRASCFATGNNIQLVGDMTRRVLLCSLDPDVERPELRVFHSNPFDAVLADRGKYVAAALLIVRAYIVAGCPRTLPPLASFEDWSRMVRSALVWLGRPDPCETMNKARSEDPITSSLSNLFTSWHLAGGSAARTVAAIKDLANANDDFGGLRHSNFREALIDVADDGRNGVNSKKLGNFLKRYEGRIISGLKLMSEEDGHSKQKAWKVLRS
jgi:hypothetical protein